MLTCLHSIAKRRKNAVQVHAKCAACHAYALDTWHGDDHAEHCMPHFDACHGACKAISKASLRLQLEGSISPSFSSILSAIL